MSKQKAIDSFLIRIDQREKLPYTFESMRASAVLNFATQLCHLPTGDYLASGGSWDMLDHCIVIERKSLADLYCTLGSHRDRFEAEWARMHRYGHAALVIEATWDQILHPLKFLSHPTELNPKSVAATLIAWSQRYGVHVHTCPGREFAEKWTYRMLERWVRDRAERLVQAM